MANKQGAITESKGRQLFFERRWLKHKDIVKVEIQDPELIYNSLANHIGFGEIHALTDQDFVQGVNIAFRLQKGWKENEHLSIVTYFYRTQFSLSNGLQTIINKGGLRAWGQEWDYRTDIRKPIPRDLFIEVDGQQFLATTGNYHIFESYTNEFRTGKIGEITAPLMPKTLEEFTKVIHTYEKVLGLFIGLACLEKEQHYPKFTLHYKIPGYAVSQLRELNPKLVADYLSRKYKTIDVDETAKVLVGAISREASQFKEMARITPNLELDGVCLICHYDGKLDLQGYERWEPHPNGIVIQAGHKLLLNGVEQIGTEDWDGWWSGPFGVCMSIYGLCVSETGVMLFERTLESYEHPELAVAGKKRKRSSLPESVDWETKIQWWTDETSFVTRYGKSFQLEQGTRGDKVLYVGDWDDWRVWKDTVIIQKGNQLLQNGKQLIYEGDFDSWNVHPLGIIIHKGRQLLLSGTSLIYEGDFDEWSIHTNGVIVRKGPDWRWISHEYFIFNLSET